MTRPALPESRELLQGLFEISQAISQVQDPEQLLRKVMDVAVETVGAERGFLVLREGPDRIRFAVSHNISEEGASRIRRPPQSIVNQVLQTGEPVLSTDAAVDARFSASESVLDAQVRSVACVPLVVRGQVQGAIYVDSLTGRGRFNQETLLFLTAFASQAAIALENARLYASLREENRLLREQLRSEYDFSEIVGNSPALRELFEILPEVSASDATVLIEGESGTGKELVARAIHQNSPRRHRPFVTVFCSSLAESVLESELFGHKRGAFTGASENKVGLFETANHGTLFLDEIGEIGPQIQVKLLRFLQNGEYRRVGETQMRHSDVRIVAATNKILADEVRAGRFREDLYYRLNVIHISLPPLRERKDDIPLLADHFLRKYARRSPKRILGFSPEAYKALRSYSWPGNVRELENAVERAIVLAKSEVITPADLRLEPLREVDSVGDTERTLEEVQRDHVLRVLRANDGNISQTARKLGVSRRWLHYKLKEWQE
ncbi:MAG: GAF domain-containing protein [Calditrichaeota bacterium]|nr:GAF domain-containing protein [Calditrichota bacterium]